MISPLSPLDFEAVAASLDPEETNGVIVLELTIRARDFGSPSLSTTVPLSIYLQDMNDHGPVFARQAYEVAIPETSAPGTPILQVRAMDLDGSPPNNVVLYRLEGPGALDKFTVDGETGWVRILCNLNSKL